MMKRLIRKFKHLLRRVLIFPAQYRLARLKSFQREKFAHASSGFESTYQNLKKQDMDPFITPLWQQFNSSLEKTLLPTPTFSFLRNRTISITMMITSRGKLMEEELAFLEKDFPKDTLRKILVEDYAGNPPLDNSLYLTSHNSIHHAYHLARFLNTTRADIRTIQTVVEWGGGYGNFAKIFKRHTDQPLTYIIIDIPLLSCLQQTYLRTVLEEDSVHLITKPTDSIMPGKINLVPLCFIKNFELKADLFVSTWALSESSATAQNYVFDKNWFGSRHLLLAYQDSNPSLPDASNLGNLAVRSGAKKEDIPTLPKNHYSFL